MTQSLAHTELASAPSVRAVWVLATSCENGMAITIHQTEREAYMKLAEVWFPSSDHHGESDDAFANRTAMMAALSESLAAGRDWFENYQLSEDTPGDAIIELHEIANP